MKCTYHQVLVAREFGGAAAIALRLAKHLHTEREEDVKVWIPGEGRAWQKAQELGLPIEAYNSQRLLSRSWLVSGLTNLRMGLKLRGQGPGLVHVHDPLRYAALRHALKLSGLATVVHVHIEAEAEGVRWAFRHPPDLIITCAAFLEDYVRGLLPAELRARQCIVAVPNSVDTSRFYPGDKAAARRAVGVPLDCPLLLMLANLAPHKGQETAIRVVGELKSRGVNVCCWMAGVEREAGGRFQAHLEEMIAASGLVHEVRLLGYRNDALALLQAADIMLLPSTREGLPLTVLEAQATKVPVIASPTAGVPEVICDGETGYLVAADDVCGYADRIAWLLHEPSRYQALVEKAYHQTITAYNWEGYRDRICTLYHDLLCSGPKMRHG